MAANPLTSQTDISLSMNRLCWVLNRDPHRAYAADFQSNKIVIPPNHEKKPKRAEHGGNLMSHSAAEKFVGDYKQPQEWKQDANGGRYPVFYTKELYIQELTEAEYGEITGKSKADIRKENATEEKKAKATLTKELKKVSNKVVFEEDDE